MLLDNEGFWSKNLNSVQSKITIKIHKELFQILLKKFQLKDQKEQVFNLIDFSDNQIIVKTNVKQLVRVILEGDLNR